MLGRILGWMFIGLAILTASADAVMALGNHADYDSLAAGEIWTLIAGRAPDFGGAATTGLVAALGEIAAWVMDLPAWVVIGPLGALLVAAFRRRQHRHRQMFRHHRTFG